MDLNTGVLKTRVVDGVAVLSFERGRFEEENEILATLESLSRYVADKTQLRILLDMTNVEYLSSAGLGQLVGLLKKVKTNGGEFRLCCLRDAIKELFEVMRLHLIFETPETEEEALALFQTKNATEPA
jgi:anti-sigma B factor antagonist